MSACEECWGRAYIAARVLGGSQVDRYADELAKHSEHATGGDDAG